MLLEKVTLVGSVRGDVLEAPKKENTSWGQWFEKMGAYFDKKFGSHKKDDEREIRRSITY